MDTAHCFITANALGYDFYDYFGMLVDKLNPAVIHLSTTDLSDGGLNDKHLHFDQGVIDFAKLKKYFVNRLLVIEVNDVSVDDINFIENLMEGVLV